MDRAKNYIGLAARGRRAVMGAQAVEVAVRNGNAKLVIIDDQSSQGSQKKYINMCTYYQVPYRMMEDPCQAAGKEGRMCLAICDSGLAAQILKALGEQTTGGRG